MTTEQIKKELLFLYKELDSAHSVLRKYTKNLQHQFENVDPNGEYPVTEIMVDHLGEDIDHILTKISWLRHLANEL